jgi:NAD(P)-dependent dehydrogenase (short-subunit alcohol dehydrogenase family)
MARIFITGSTDGLGRAAARSGSMNFGSTLRGTWAGSASRRSSGKRRANIHLESWRDRK